MPFTAQDVKTLREMTECGMLDCKKALIETDGDMEKAVEFLREKGLASVAKKAGRIAAEGIVLVFGDEAKKASVAIEVNSETDFVSKNEDFRSFVKLAGQAVIDNNPADVEALLACVVDGRTVNEHLQDRQLKIRENLKVRRFVRYEGDVATYVHGGGTIGVMVKFATDVADKEGFAEFGKDIAMQIAAANPAYLCEHCVPAEVIEHEKEILFAQISNDEKLANKPDAVKEKMVDGRIGKYYKENCLMNQEFVKDPDLDIKGYVEKVAKELGGSIKITEFVRLEKGEGIEKKQENFADEVAKQMAGK
ncbi:MAG: elongation factor Ts [Oscillospiraceae bacterium]|nr:elongation factor Ts [Oscillospiraceae bacterium]